jgi:signal peptidase II
VGRRRLLLVYGTAAAVIAADQFTKWLVVSKLAGRPPLNLVGEFVRFRYTTNTGGAFSIFNGFPLFFALMAVIVAVAIAFYSRRVASPAVLVTLGLLLGGALGNVTDRIFHGDGLFRGEVVDFVDVGNFPVFNVADSCITIGAILLAILLTRGETQPAEDAAADRTPTTEP